VPRRHGGQDQPAFGIVCFRPAATDQHDDLACVDLEIRPVERAGGPEATVPAGCATRESARSRIGVAAITITVALLRWRIGAPASRRLVT